MTRPHIRISYKPFTTDVSGRETIVMRFHGYPKLDEDEWPCARCGEAIYSGDPIIAIEFPTRKDVYHIECGPQLTALGGDSK